MERSGLPLANGLVCNGVAAAEEQFRNVTEAELVAEAPEDSVEDDAGRVLEVVEVGAGALVEAPTARCADKAVVAEGGSRGGSAHPLRCLGRIAVRARHGWLLDDRSPQPTPRALKPDGTRTRSHGGRCPRNQEPSRAPSARRYPSPQFAVCQQATSAILLVVRTSECAPPRCICPVTNGGRFARAP